MKRDYKKIGNFTMTCSTMRVTDPSYDKLVWCSGEIPNCLTGNWEAAVIYSDEGEFGSRVALLAARHTDVGDTFAVCNHVWMDKKYIHYSDGWEICSFEVGVDSGQAGLFDDAHYQDNRIFDGIPAPVCDFGSVWYNHCCDLTLGEQQAGVIPHGAVTSSGYGDGCYTALQHKKEQGLVDSVLVLFIPERKKRARDK